MEAQIVKNNAPDGEQLFFLLDNSGVDHFTYYPRVLLHDHSLDTKSPYHMRPGVVHLHM